MRFLIFLLLTGCASSAVTEAEMNAMLERQDAEAGVTMRSAK